MEWGSRFKVGAGPAATAPRKAGKWYPQGNQ